MPKRKKTLQECSNTRKSSRRRRYPTQTTSFETTENSDAKLMQEAIRASLSTHGAPKLAEIRDAPVYYPTEQQFQDPISFIDSIRNEAEQFGICSVVPPSSWTPPLLQERTQKFHTRRQLVHRLQEALGFDSGDHYTVKEYRKMAQTFEQKYFDDKHSMTLENIEKMFWEIVQNSSAPVEVEYANDISSIDWGSAFPQNDSSHSKYSRHPWNLNNFAKLPGSVIRKLPPNISGVNAPWVYFGMLFSSFCWHAEDLWMYSINYLHFGQNKTWYGIPGSHAADLEHVMREQAPELFRAEPDLMLKLVTMLSPSIVLANDIPVCRAQQAAGQFIITFPKAYHAGFNNGFNCSEAVNFASSDWLIHGLDAVEECRKHSRRTVFSPEQLLFDLVLYRQSHNLNDDSLLEPLSRCIAIEKNLREYATSIGVINSTIIQPNMHRCTVNVINGDLNYRKLYDQIDDNCNAPPPPLPGSETADTFVGLPQCSLCQQFCVLSYAFCPCTPNQVVCLRHIARNCQCPTHLWTVAYRFNLDELMSLQDSVVSSASLISSSSSSSSSSCG